MATNLRLPHLLERLITPHPEVTAADTRRQVQLFLAGSVTLLAIAAFGTANAFLIGLPRGSVSSAWIMAAVTGALLAGFILGRSRRPLAGIILTTALLCLAPFVDVIIRASALQGEYSDQFSMVASLAWLGPALIFAAILLPFRTLLALAGGTWLATLVLVVWVTGGSWLRSLPSLGLVLAISTLLVIARIQANQLEIIHLGEMRQARDELEKRVQERTAHLARLNAELKDARRGIEEAYRSRSSYLAEISHELRTPLTVILGYSEMLNFQARKAGADEETRRYLGYIETAARYLVDLSQNLVDLSRLERGEMTIQPQPVALAALLDEVILMARLLAAKNNNTLESDLEDGPGEIHTDPIRLRQILLNLLNNAAQYTENGRINLRVRRSSDTNGRDWVTLEVSDTGIGLTPGQLQTLFQPYPPSFRSASERFSGAGLGLAITQRLCKLLGGEITVQSQVHLGSTFTVRLPANILDSPQEYSGHPL